MNPKLSRRALLGLGISVIATEVAANRLRFKGRIINPPPPTDGVGPSALWNGTGGSGFSGSPPQLAERLTAMPAIRWQTAHYQRFAGDFWICADSDALGGVSHVNYVVEGTTVTVNEWTIRTVPDANGVMRKRGGFWLKLNHAAFMAQAGAAPNTIHIYGEGVPINPLMQPRVIGPLVLHPELTEHDMTGTIRLDGAGGAYTSIKAALDAARAATARSPKFTITQDGFYPWESSTAAHYTGGRGYAVITHAPGVTATIGKAVLDEAVPDITPRYDAIELRGEGIVLDTRNFVLIQCSTTSTTGGRNHRLNGIRITTSEGTPRSYYWGHGMKAGGLLKSRPSAHLRVPQRMSDFLCQDGSPDGAGFIEDCYIEYCNAVLTGLALSRGNNCHDCIERWLNGTPAAFDNYSDRTGTEWFRTWRPAMNITYTGPATTATVAKAGNNNSTGPFRLTENGVEVLSMTLGLRSTDPWHSFQQIADYINGVSGTLGGVSAADWAAAHPGWSVTLKSPDVEVRTSYMGATTTEDGSTPHPNFSGPGVLSPISCKNTTVYLGTWNEVHSGGDNHYYTNGVVSGSAGNVLRRNNVHLGIDYDRDPEAAGDNFTNVLFDVAAQLFDMFWVNCVWQGGGGVKGKDTCSLSHVMFIHCTGVDASASPFCKNIDPYSGFQNSIFNVVTGATSNGGNLVAQTVSQNSYAVPDFSGFKLNQPSGATGNIQGVSGDLRYVNEAGQDFRPAPAGVLAANLRPRKTRYDLFGNERSAMDAIGAISLNTATLAWPDLGAFPA